MWKVLYAITEESCLENSSPQGEGCPQAQAGPLTCTVTRSCRECHHVIIVLGNLSPWQVTSRLFRIPRYSQLRRVTSTHPRSSTQWRSLAWVAILESTHEGAPLLTGQTPPPSTPSSTPTPCMHKNEKTMLDLEFPPSEKFPPIQYPIDYEHKI